MACEFCCFGNEGRIPETLKITMPLTAKKLGTQKAMQPIAVQIDYADGLKIEA